MPINNDYFYLLKFIFMQQVNAAIITVGDELLIGQTIDTNSAFISREFNKAGIWVKRRVAVGDNYDDIRMALDEESKHASVIIITGGLGPTADDITKPLLCDYFGCKLVMNNEVLEHVQHLFNNVFKKPGALLQRNINQALVPDCCTVLHNKNGTAPGMWFEKVHSNGRKTVYAALPGVPHEMKGLIVHEVLPRIKSTFQLQAIAHRTIITFGQGESVVAERLVAFEAALPTAISLAYLPSFGQVKLRLSARGDSEDALLKDLNSLSNRLKTILEDIVIATTDEPMEAIIGSLLTKTGKTLGTAESCTGGNIAHLITSVAGASQYFKGSVVAYSNEIKTALLQVSEKTLQQYGAVSEETVVAMANGLLLHLKTDYAIATSGIMGPDGGTANKPVGTVWVAVAGKGKTATTLLHLRFDRAYNIEVASVQALNFLRAFLIANP